MPAKIILAGEGGQGVQVIAKILAETAYFSDKKSTYIPSFGVEQRGGVSLTYVQVSSHLIPYPRFTKADYIILMSSRAAERIKDFIQPGTTIIYDDSVVKSNALEKIKNDTKNYIKISAAKIAKEKFSVKASNLILLGVLSARLKDLNYREFEKVIIKEFLEKAKKDNSIQENNLKAFNYGIQLAEGYDASGQNFTGAEEKEMERIFECKTIKWTRYPGYCKGCSLCIIKCPVNALTFSKDENFLGTPMPIIDTEKCIGCGKCSDICPDGAIKIEGKKHE